MRSATAPLVCAVAVDLCRVIIIARSALLTSSLDNQLVSVRGRRRADAMTAEYRVRATGVRRTESSATHNSAGGMRRCGLLCGSICVEPHGCLWWSRGSSVHWWAFSNPNR